MEKVVLISCSSKKEDREMKAEHIYTSELFIRSLQYARHLNSNKIYILSAKYGLLNLDTIIQPYDVTLSYVTPKDRRPGLKVLNPYENKQWANNVLNQLREENIDINNTKFIILAGKSYFENLIPLMTNYELPLDGLKVGERLQFLGGKI